MAKWTIKLAKEWYDSSAITDAGSQDTQQLNLLHIAAGSFWGFRIKVGDATEFVHGFCADLPEGSFMNSTYQLGDGNIVDSTIRPGDEVEVTGLLEFNCQLAKPLPLKLWHKLMPSARSC